MSYRSYVTDFSAFLNYIAAAGLIGFLNVMTDSLYKMVR
jgi:hypothetical protein